MAQLQAMSDSGFLVLKEPYLAQPNVNGVVVYNTTIGDHSVLLRSAG